MSTNASLVRGRLASRGPGEEIANAITHGVGAVLSPAAVAILVLAARSGGARRIASFAVYGASILLLFTVSSLYHSLTPQKAKRLFRIFDHASIYVLIAGTYTAYSVGLLGGSTGWILFGLAWGIAVAGILFEVFFIGKYRILSIVAYVALGWLVAPVLGMMRAALGPASYFLLAAGGVAYTAGIVFYSLKKVPYMHAVWHLFVLAGAACHFASILVGAARS